MALHLVAGGSGYFGALLVDALVASGESVRVLDLHSPDEAPPAIDFVQGDLRDASTVARACRGVEVVHNCVAQVPLARDPELFRTVNVDGTARLLEAASAGGVRKVVHLSSSAVYGAPAKLPVDETSVPHPAEAYGRAKLEGEWLCREWVTRGLDVTIIRPRTILGHGRLGIFQILFEWVRTGRNVPVFGRGDSTYQFVHADDLVDACLRAAGREGAGVYCIGTDRFGSMRESLQALVDHAGTGSRVVSVPRRPAELGMRLAAKLRVSPLADYHRIMYGRSLWFDVSLAKRELGWAPRFGNVELLCDSYDWYLAHRDEVLARRDASAHRSAVRQGALAVVSRLL